MQPDRKAMLATVTFATFAVLWSIAHYRTGATVAAWLAFGNGALALVALFVWNVLAGPDEPPHPE